MYVIYIDQGYLVNHTISKILQLSLLYYHSIVLILTIWVWDDCSKGLEYYGRIYLLAYFKRRLKYTFLILKYLYTIPAGNLPHFYLTFFNTGKSHSNWIPSLWIIVCQYIFFFENHFLPIYPVRYKKYKNYSNVLYIFEVYMEQLFYTHRLKMV